MSVEFTELIASSLMGDGIITARDEKGIYVMWDEIFIDGPQRKVFFKNKGKVVGEMPHNVATFTNTSVNLVDLEGRLRVKLF